MKIIQEGQLPGKHEYLLEGTCRNCGCIVQAPPKELTTVIATAVGVLMRGELLCPTEGCRHTIHMTEVVYRQ